MQRRRKVERCPLRAWVMIWLDERPHQFAAGQREVLITAVLDQRLGHVAKHRKTMGRRRAEAAADYSVTHGCTCG